MIGAAALSRMQRKFISSSLDMGVSARWPLEGADKMYEMTPPF